MLLEDYRTLNNMSYKELATFLGLKSPTSAMRYCIGTRYPKLNILIRIQDKTKQAVTANDFVAKYRELHEQKIQP